MTFSARHARELAWFFGRGMTYVEPGAIDYGARRDAPARAGQEPAYAPIDDGALVRFGLTSRALFTLPRPFDGALALAYGDAGEAATRQGAEPSRRWYAVAHLTPLARARGPVWAAELPGELAPGDPSRRWVERVFSAVTRGAGPKTMGGFHDLRAEGLALLAESERRFADAFDGIIGRERAIARANARRSAVGGSSGEASPSEH